MCGGQHALALEARRHVVLHHCPQLVPRRLAVRLQLRQLARHFIPVHLHHGHTHAPVTSSQSTYITATHTHARTHTRHSKVTTLYNTHPLNGRLSRTTQVSRYQKRKTNLDFTGARDSEWQWHQLGHMQVCTLLQTDNHASTPPLSFYRPDALPATLPTASKH